MTKWSFCSCFGWTCSRLPWFTHYGLEDMKKHHSPLVWTEAFLSNLDRENLLCFGTCRTGSHLFRSLWHAQKNIYIQNADYLCLPWASQWLNWDTSAFPLLSSTLQSSFFTRPHNASIFRSVRKRRRVCLLCVIIWICVENNSDSIPPSSLHRWMWVIRGGYYLVAGCVGCVLGRLWGWQRCVGGTGVGWRWSVWGKTYCRENTVQVQCEHTQYLTGRCSLGLFHYNYNWRGNT